MRSKMIVVGVFVTTVCVIGAGVFAQGASEPLAEGAQTAPVISVSPEEGRPVVQMAILLDTSGSMSGLIDQARTELWSVVNEFIAAERNGMQPEVHVALYEYGNSSLSGEEGYIRQIAPLTRDLDLISAELFALTTNGGDEYCGWVIREAAEDLAWSESPDDLKVIFIAGNEPFTQGPVDHKEACREAITRGIVVNTIHCGPEQQGIDGKWKHGAVLADGRYLNIDQNRQVVHVAAPQDEEIAELSARLNETYVPYGRQGQVARERQVVQDRNAKAANAEAAIQRAVTKASSNYHNGGWDLVDAVDANQVDLDALEPASLPENMRAMDVSEREAYLQRQAAQRRQVQARIQKLNDERKQYVAEQMKQQATGRTLGLAITELIREQARAKNYTFRSPEASTESVTEEPQRLD